MSEHASRFDDELIERDPELTPCHRKPGRRLFGRRRPTKLERVQAQVATYEADLVRLQPSPVLRTWDCGEIKVCVDAALRVRMLTTDAFAVVGELDGLAEALYAAEAYAEEAANVVRQSLLA
jgi:hypothetical protein